MYRWLLKALLRRVNRVQRSRSPDFIIGGANNPYLLRWYLTPWSAWNRHVPDSEKSLWQKLVSRLPGIYLHEFRRSDDDRALHDHPWANCSMLLVGSYNEHTIAAGGIHQRTLRAPGAFVFRRAKAAHRVELINNESTLSLFFIGFRVRHWGFHCAEAGWIPWKQFVSASDRGSVGKGCG